MALIVQKYGGTSVGSPERIRAVAKRIAATRAQGHQLVVVVSAMGDTTDDLIALAHQVSQSPPNREMDMLLTAGERISMALLSMALVDLSVPAVSFTGSQTGIITDESHRRARIKRILGDRVRTGVAQEKVAIIAGFQGVSETKEITTLGRGGSDTTAVALAAALKAKHCEIYTDVDGVFTADPRIVPDARHWKRIPHELMVELATRGAGVLHPRSVELAWQYGVDLWVKNSLKESEGTHVSSSADGSGQQGAAPGSGPEMRGPETVGMEMRGMEEFTIVGVSEDSGKMLVTVELHRATAINAIWDTAAESHLAVLAPMFSDGRVQFFANQDAEPEWRKHLEHLAVQGFIKKYQIDAQQIPVSVVGYRFAQDGGALAAVIDVLARQHVSVSVGSASSLAITVAVPAHHAKDAVKALHSELVTKGKT